MATTIDNLNLHDHSGIRWFAPMMAGVVIVVIGTLLMLLYPWLTL
jgi:hypothetical protein